MKTFQIWFINDDVLMIQAQSATATDNVARFFVGDDLVAAFSCDQILGFANIEAIAEADDDSEDI
jgi:hypothetical protein